MKERTVPTKIAPATTSNRLHSHKKRSDKGADGAAGVAGATSGSG